jgi:hypothetical protein
MLLDDLDADTVDFAPTFDAAQVRSSSSSSRLPAVMQQQAHVCVYAASQED